MFAARLPQFDSRAGRLGGLARLPVDHPGHPSKHLGARRGGEVGNSDRHGGGEEGSELLGLLLLVFLHLDGSDHDSRVSRMLLLRRELTQTKDKRPSRRHAMYVLYRE